MDIKDIKYGKFDTLFGSFMTCTVAAFIIIATAGVFHFNPDQSQGYREIDSAAKTAAAMPQVLHGQWGQWASYQEAVDSPIRPADIVATRAYRYKYGFGLNVEQEIIKNVGAFARLGWSDGGNEAWTFADVDRTATLGVSVKGESWCRPSDTAGLAGVLNGISPVHQQFFEAGGTGILGGDGALNYAWEKVIETYYDFQVWKTLHATLDYQFVSNPAYNRDRGPVSILGARVHWQF